MKGNELINNIIKILYCLVGILGMIATLIYIFYTSTALLTSDSVITDHIVHQQILNKEFLLSHWYYGNEFWLFALNIPTLILSFFIKNNLLLRQVSVLLTALIFFFILYKYGVKFLNKKERLIVIIIFLSGISYSILDYFYAFNAYLTVVINSLLTIYLFYKGFEEKNKKYIYLSVIVSFLINISSLRYFPSVTLPLVITEIIMIFLSVKNHRKICQEKKKQIINILIFLLVSVIGISLFFLLTKLYHYEQRAGTKFLSEFSFDVLKRDAIAIFECINNFFGYDNENNPVVLLAGNQYFVNNARNYSFISFYNFTNIIKIIMAILTIVVCPITLFFKYNKNDKKINFLLLFNTISWILMIFCYVFTTRFFYNYSESKYFILNILINIILCIYTIYKYLVKGNKTKILFDIFILVYIISNLYTTYLTIRDNNKEVIDKKYELVKLLKDNDLTFGYSFFWDSLITSYLSDYDITVASIGYYSKIKPYEWYSDERWYKKDYHKGKIFLIYNEIFIKNADYYSNMYGEPDKILMCDGFYVYVYNENIIAEQFE